jgi:hypothetical protein
MSPKILKEPETVCWYIKEYKENEIVEREKNYLFFIL